MYRCCLFFRLLCVTYEFSALLGYVCSYFWFGKEKIRFLVLLQCLCKHFAMQDRDLAEMENGLVVYIKHSVATLSVNIAGQDYCLKTDQVLQHVTSCNVSSSLVS